MKTDTTGVNLCCLQDPVTTTMGSTHYLTRGENTMQRKTTFYCTDLKETKPHSSILPPFVNA